VPESLTLEVNPGGHLTRDMTIHISCTARYGGPAMMSPNQDPNLMLTLDNTPAFPAGKIYYEAPSDSTNFHIKRLVSLLAMQCIGSLEALFCLISLGIMLTLMACNSTMVSSEHKITIEH